MALFDKLDLNDKIKTGLGFSLFVLILSSILSFFSIRALIDQSRWVDHTNQVIIDLQNIMAIAKDAESGQRGYLLSGDPSYLQHYHGAHDKTILSYNKLRALTADNPRQQRYLDALFELINERFKTMDLILESYNRQLAISQQSLAQGQKIMAQFELVVEKMESEERRLLVIRSQDVDRYAAVAPVIIVLSSLFSVALSLLSFYFISKDIQTRAKLQTELDQKNFVLAGTAKLNDLLRGEKNMERAGASILRHLCEYTSASAGLFYTLSPTNQLMVNGTYGLSADKYQVPWIDVGDTLVGQAALNRKSVMVTEVPVNSLQIKTGAASMSPLSIFVVPFYLDQSTVAVAELLHHQHFTQASLDYVESLADIIAVFVTNIEAEHKTTELLSETQNQAEELEAQQEELRQINDELREQRDKIQASEEELRASEEELQEKNAELELQYESLHEKNRALEEARQAVQIKIDEVETVSKYKSDFLANMSHELRTPLNSILILSSLLRDNKGGRLTDKEVEQASVIQKSGSDLLKLINEILDLSRIEAGKIKLEIEELLLKNVDIHQQFTDLAKDKKIDFDFEIDSTLPQAIQTDKFRLDQILKNLLSNAFKFTPEGGKVLFKITQPKAGTFFQNPALRTGPVFGFVVTDTGVGIAEDKTKLIFEAFQQADASTTRKFGGTGLGLTISRDLAHLLGGEIQVGSEPGKGSTFTLYLPERLEEYASAIMPPASVPDSPKSTVFTKPTEPTISNSEDDNSILIIEDDIYFGKILAEYAGRKGFKVYSAANGSDGLKMASLYHPSAILLDVQLPVMNGWEVLKNLKADPRLKPIPVHLMSAYDMQGKINELGQETFLPKPITLEMLDAAFSEISSKRANFRKVLVVEDNHNENSAVKDLLQSQGLEAYSAYSGQEALSLIRSNNYDCIILDITLPDINGFDILKQLKTDEETTDIPVIIYSGKDLSEDEEAKFRKYTDTIIIKTDQSYTRLLDEVKLFIHDMDKSIQISALKKRRLHQPEAALQSKKVLVADDDMRNIFSLSSVLEENGMEVFVAYNGQQAILELEAHPDIDIILMDIMMPEIDGLEATKKIRAKHEFQHIPIIAVTARAMPGDKENFLTAGVSDYISKPLDLNKLLSLMRVWIYKA